MHSALPINEGWIIGRAPLDSTVLLNRFFWVGQQKEGKKFQFIGLLVGV